MEEEIGGRGTDGSRRETRNRPSKVRMPSVNILKGDVLRSKLTLTQSIGFLYPNTFCYFSLAGSYPMVYPDFDPVSL